MRFVPRLFFASRQEELGNEAGPARLMRSAEALSAVAVKILVEEQTVGKVGIALQFFPVTEARAAARLVATRRPVADLAINTEGPWVELWALLESRSQAR